MHMRVDILLERKKRKKEKRGEGAKDVEKGEKRVSIKYLAVDALRLIFGISVMVAALNMQNQQNKNTATATRKNLRARMG